MAKLTQEGFRTVKPTLKAEDLQGHSHVVVTIASAEVTTVGKGVNQQKLLAVQTEEFPDKIFFPNTTSISELINGLGDETNDWTGKKVPLHVVRTKNPTNNKDVQALWVVPASEWEQHLSAPDSPQPRGRRARA